MLNGRSKFGRTNSIWLQQALLFCFIGIVTLIQPQPVRAMSSVQVVGCTEENITGGAPTPSKIGTVRLDIPSTIAKRLSLYSGERESVLAPRGWSCIERIGGDSAILQVYPEGSKSNGGQTVEKITMGADNNEGAWLTMAYICKYFSKTTYANQKLCVSGSWALSEGLQGVPRTSPFVLPNYADDRISYINNFMLHYITPADRLGLGTSLEADVRPNKQAAEKGTPAFLPTDGLLVIGSVQRGVDILDGIQISAIRLSIGDSDLLSDIIRYQKDNYLGNSKD